MVTQNSSIDPPYDIKTNLRDAFIFERFQIKIIILYFFYIFCFIENVSINFVQSKCDTFCSQLGECSITIKSIY